MDKIPDEVLLRIFSLISPRDLATKVSKVCSRWKRVATDDELWPHVYCIGDWQRWNQVNRSRQDQKYLLHMKSSFRIEEMIQLTEDGVKFKHLELSFCNKQHVKSALSCCIQNEIQLTKLSFQQGTTISTSAVKLLATSPYSSSVRDIFIHKDINIDELSSFAEFRNLQKFDYRRVGYKGVKSAVLMYWPKLTEVFLCDVVLLNCEVEKMIRHLTVLESLTLIRCFFERNSLEPLMGNESLKHVEMLSSFSIDPRINYAPIFTLPNVTSLYCDMMKSLDEPIILFQSISQSLTTLQLQGVVSGIYHEPPITDEPILLIAERCKNLKSFNLLSCKVSGEGMRKFISKATNLENFTVSESGLFHQLDTYDWAGTLSNHPSLKSLDFARYHISKEIGEILIEICKNCRITLKIQRILHPHLRFFKK